MSATPPRTENAPGPGPDDGDVHLEADSTPPELPTRRPSRVAIEPVSPVVDGGRYRAKGSLGHPIDVVADVFTDGHDLVAAALRYRRAGGEWTEVPMTAAGNDRWQARFLPDALGPWEYELIGWVDHFSTWLHGYQAKVEVGGDDQIDRLIGAELLDAMTTGASAGDRRLLNEAGQALQAGRSDALASVELAHCVRRTQSRTPTARSARLPLWVDRDRARFSAWYELFPRSTIVDGSTAADRPAHGTLRDVKDRLDYVAAMGFDVLYLPPIHPIGETKRKGANNVTESGPDEPGSPWAIGGASGGHTAVHPALGTIDDLVELVSECARRNLDLALDIAFQCSPDHPWVTEHPSWFQHRPDGSIQYAENPPKRYQDIYPLDFESDDWASLWQALRDVFEFWIGTGVRVFRVDNPHTKAFAFWEWVIADITTTHPDVILLAEAFTRPRVMQRLAKLGFTQSYTYFAWRQSSWELADYFTELATESVDYFRPNAWPNTPDILTEQLQHGGRPAFVSRAVLAATLSASWGVYGPAFELQEREPQRPGSEEYLDSEKYQLRRWDLDQSHSLAPLLTRLNAIRRANPAFQNLGSLRFHSCDNPALLAYSKTDIAGHGDPVLVVVNLDPEQVHSGTVDVDWAALGLPYDDDYVLADQLGGAHYRWAGARNYVSLDPRGLSAHIFTARVAADEETNNG